MVHSLRLVGSFLSYNSDSRSERSVTGLLPTLPKLPRLHPNHPTSGDPFLSNSLSLSTRSAACSRAAMTCACRNDAYQRCTIAGRRLGGVVDVAAEDAEPATEAGAAGAGEPEGECVGVGGESGCGKELCCKLSFGTNAPATPFQTFFAFCFVSFLRSLASRLLDSRLASRSSFSSMPWSPYNPLALPAPTHHHQPRKLCQRITAHIRLGNQTYSSSLGTYKKLSAVLTTARERAAHPNAAVPPSVRQACLRLTRRPQMKREAVNSKESVALQTFLTADATALTLALFCIGKSCMTAATMANGPMLVFRM
jgi:hypothetical protein